MREVIAMSKKKILGTVVLVIMVLATIAFAIAKSNWEYSIIFGNLLA